MRANLADRKTLHSRAFSYVSLISYWQRFFFRSFPSLHTPSSMPNIKSLVYNQYMCTSYAREPLLIFCVVVVVAKYLKCAYDFVIYLFGARSMMCKSSFLIFFVSFLLFLFICVNVRVLFAPCLSFHVQSIRNGKGRNNNNANAKKRTEEHSVMGIGGKIMNEINLHRQLFFLLWLDCCEAVAAHNTFRLFNAFYLIVFSFDLVLFGSMGRVNVYDAYAFERNTFFSVSFSAERSIYI